MPRCPPGSYAYVITDPLKSGQSLFSMQTDHLTLIDFTIELIQEADTSQLRMDTDESQGTLANTKLPPKTDSETTSTITFVHNVNAC